jgi:hypothetical protein
MHMLDGWVVCLLLFSKVTNWQECQAAPATDNSMFLMLIVAFGQNFDYSNHPITFTVNRTV